MARNLFPWTTANRVTSKKKLEVFIKAARNHNRLY